MNLKFLQLEFRTEIHTNISHQDTDYRKSVCNLKETDPNPHMHVVNLDTPNYAAQMLQSFVDGALTRYL